jgi:ATP-dependent helicase HrpA
VEVIGPDKKTMGASRDLNELREKLEKEKPKVAAVAPETDPAWKSLAQKWEKFGVTDWSFGDLPERLTVSESGAIPVYAWPGLQADAENNVHVQLFRNQAAARRASLAGFQQLVCTQLQKDLAWLQKDLRAFTRLDALTANFCSVPDLIENAYQNLQRYLLPSELPSALTEANFRKAVASARELLPGLAMRLVDLAGNLLKQRQEILRRCGPPPAAPKTTKTRSLADLKLLDTVAVEKRPANPWAEELNRLMPANFLTATPFEQIPHLFRYLKALQIRMERAALNPLKDQERARQLAPYLEILRKAAEQPPSGAEARVEFEKFRWMVEEFKVSLFAQELGTAQPVSPKRLDEQRQRF